MNPSSVLIIDDEAPIRKLLEITLQSNGYQVCQAATAREGMLRTAMFQPNLVILDLGLPDEDGQSILLKLREWYFKPIIILSARHSESEIIRALDNGANDYLVKPFRTGELLARIRSCLRMSFPELSEPVLNIKQLSIDFVSRTVRKNGELLKLTSTEYALLTLLIKNEGKVLTHSFILSQIWGPGYIERTEYPRVFIGQLRKKIEDNSNQPIFIRTESGVGYRFTAD